MDVVIGFKSGAPKAEGEDAILRGYDYGLISDAILVNREVAENVFARCAKRKLRHDLGETVRMATNDGILPHVTYHSSVSMITEVKEVLDTKEKDWLAAELYRLTERLSWQIRDSKSIAARNTVILVDAMSAQLLEVSPRCFSFRLGQKWGIE